MRYLQLIPKDDIISETHKRKMVAVTDEARKLNVVSLVVSSCDKFVLFLLVFPYNLKAVFHNRCVENNVYIICLFYLSHINFL